jgi:hypothetical protein
LQVQQVLGYIFITLTLVVTSLGPPGSRRGGPVRFPVCSDKTATVLTVGSQPPSPRLRMAVERGAFAERWIQPRARAEPTAEYGPSAGTAGIATNK